MSIKINDDAFGNIFQFFWISVSLVRFFSSSYSHILLYSFIWRIDSRICTEHFWMGNFQQSNASRKLKLWMGNGHLCLYCYWNHLTMTMMTVNSYEITINVFWIWVPIHYFLCYRTDFRSSSHTEHSTESFVHAKDRCRWVHSKRAMVAILYIPHLFVITIMCNPVLTTWNQLWMCDLHVFWAFDSF